MHERPVVVLSGGGTGGHLYPALAIADALRALRPDVAVVFLGAERGIEARVLPARGEVHHLLPVFGIDRARPLSALRAVAGLARSLARVLRLFAVYRPKAVVVTGGYAGAPAGLAAVLRGVPLVVQEQNSVPGVVTRLLARRARRVHVAFPEVLERLGVKPERARVSGNPVRSASGRERAAARAVFGIPADARLVLVTGGSQGALALNRAVADMLRAVAEGSLARPEGLHLLWSTGPAHHESVAQLLRELGPPEWVHARAYIEEMPDALAAADLAVCRAGAMFTAELLQNALPAVLVPLPTATADHQTHNARALERGGAAVVVPQSDLTPASLLDTVARLLADRHELERMRAAARALARPNAAAEIAADVAGFLGAGPEARRG